MSRKTLLSYIIFTLFSAFLSEVHAQQSNDASVLSAKGDELRREYRFEESIKAYSDALDTAGDSLARYNIRERLLLSENGLNMADFVYRPSVLAKARFSIEDFFLYYPVENNAWRPVPNDLDASGHEFSKALYAPQGRNVIYYSAKDSEGIRNLYATTLKGSLWSMPSLLNEHLTSDSDEIYPMLSPDGKSLYFASKGLHGVGGYDLYVSHWDEDTRDWAEPVNLGFPYSSPEDDFLFITMEDGKAMFASNRDCSKDSVYLYVIDYDDLPVRRPVEDPRELKEISRLNPKSGNKQKQEHKESSIPENVDIRRYMDKMSEVRALQDSISLYGELLEKDRERFAQSEDDDHRQRYVEGILKREAGIPVFRDSLDRAVALLRKIEMEFLFNGVVIDPEKLVEEADVEVVVDDKDYKEYVFSKQSMGQKLKFEIEVPIPKFDYSFKILDKGQFAEDNTIPDGVVYQIQIFSVASKAKIRDLKGLSPVFEDRTASGRYIYKAGIFKTYNDVLSKLNTVKKRGFRSAFIVAYIDGKSVAVSKARAAETQIEAEAPSFYELRISPPGGNLDPAIADGIRQLSSGRDIARITRPDGSVEYVTGPFNGKEAVDKIADFVRAMGVNDVVVKELVSPSENNKQ